MAGYPGAGVCHCRWFVMWCGLYCSLSLVWCIERDCCGYWIGSSADGRYGMEWRVESIELNWIAESHLRKSSLRGKDDCLFLIWFWGRQLLALELEVMRSAIGAFLQRCAFARWATLVEYSKTFFYTACRKMCAQDAICVLFEET